MKDWDQQWWNDKEQEYVTWQYECAINDLKRCGYTNKRIIIEFNDQGDVSWQEEDNASKEK